MHISLYILCYKSTIIYPSDRKNELVTYRIRDGKLASTTLQAPLLQHFLQKSLESRLGLIITTLLLITISVAERKDERYKFQFLHCIFFFIFFLSIMTQIYKKTRT